MIYVASKTARAPMWRTMRESGVPIISTWIDEAGEGETKDAGELWVRIMAEIGACERLVVAVDDNDGDLTGALLEVGAALALGKPVVIVGDHPQLRKRVPFTAHPLVSRERDFRFLLPAALPYYTPQPETAEGRRG